MDIFDLPSIEVSASELPESIIARFPERPAADARLVIRVEASDSTADRGYTVQEVLDCLTESDPEFQALKKAIDLGIADLDAGRFSPFEDVIARLEKRFPPPSDL